MQKIIYTCPFVPAEWIAAFGFGPARIIPRGNHTNQTLPRTEGLCAFAKAWTNEVISNTDCRGAIFTTACDQMRRAYDIAATKTKTPTFLMNVPSTWQSPESVLLYIDELNRLGRWMCTLGAKAPSDESLAKTMTEYDNNRPSHAPRRSTSANTIPLGIVGGPVLQNDRKIFDIVTRAGGQIVLDATETGERTLPDTFDKDAITQNPQAELARAYLQHIPTAWKRPNHQLFEWLQRKCTERQIKGLIYHRYVFCDIWHAELYRIKDSLSLPVLDLDASEDSPSVCERTINRIQAFLETLQ